MPFRASRCLIQSTGKDGDAVCSNFDAACRDGSIRDLAERYILECRKKDGGAKGGRVPNLAGFFRYCGFDGSDLSRIPAEYPEIYSSLCMIFEDEALNSSLSPTVLSVYLKKRLGYNAEDNTGRQSVSGGGQLRLVFEHDITEDGM